MPKQETLAELNAEKEKIERQLVQEQHIIQRLENRAAYYAKGERRTGLSPVVQPSRASHRRQKI